MNFGMLIELAGGLGMFIYGMKMMGDGLERAAGDRMKRFLEILTSNRFIAVIVGALITVIIQSSSVTTVMVVGFVNAGLMNLLQAAGIIMGANIGTTITAQLIAFQITDVAYLSLFVGVGLVFFSKSRSVKKIGEIIAGFGILFIGLKLMSDAMYPLRDNESFKNLMVQFKNPLWGVLAGLGITVVIQSSSASIAILQALAMQQGLISLEGAIFILFGQNIGTCITAILASIGTSVTAKRAAVIHLLFNVIGTIFFMALILLGVPYIQFIESLTPGADRVARQIANAHTGFNIVNTILLFPFANSLVSLSKKLVRRGKESIAEEKRLIYLDKRILESPPIAVAQITKEIGRMAELARQNVNTAMESFFTLSEASVNEVYRVEDIINYLNKEITSYLVMVNGLDLPDHDLELVGGFFHVVNDIERIGDHAENLVEYAEYRMENKLNFSDIAIGELIEIKDKVLNMLDASIEALETRNKGLAETVEPLEESIDHMKDALRDSHIARLNNQQCSPSAGVIYLDIISNLERIADHASNIAYSVID